MKCVLANKKEIESVLDVYNRTKDVFYDASEFLHALDVLYVLGFLSVSNDSELIEYA